MPYAAVSCNLPNYEGHIHIDWCSVHSGPLAAAVAPNEPALREEMQHGSSSTRLKDFCLRRLGAWHNVIRGIEGESKSKGWEMREVDGNDG